MKSRPFEERLWSRIDFDASCWVWTGTIKGTGYGVIGRGPRGAGCIRVHRAVWELLVGPIPDGLEIDHLCRNRVCCNPDHLEPVTRAVNNARGVVKDQRRRWVDSLTRCKRGHPFDVPNTRITKSGARACRACQAMWARSYREAAAA